MVVLLPEGKILMRKIKHKTVKMVNTVCVHVDVYG